MSDSEQPASPSRLAINTTPDESASAAFNPDGSVETYTSKESVGVSFNKDGTTTRTDLPEDDTALEQEVDADLGDSEASTEEAPKPDEGEAEPVAELPDFDADNEEIVKQYDERYSSEDGTLNFEAFNKSFYDSIQSGAEKPDISAAERAYVKKKTGISDAAIDTYLEGVASKAKAADDAVYSEFGGKDSFEAAMAWATGEGGYSAAQKERFNKALKAGGEELKEQLDLLRARAPKAEPAAPAQKVRRPASPATSATAAASSGTPVEQGYASLAEYQKDMAAASAKNDIPGMKAAEAKLKASPKLYRG